MTSEMTSGEIDKVGLALITWEQMIQQTKHYFAQGSDYFTVSAGPWTLTFDNRKESEVK